MKIQKKNISKKAILIAASIVVVILLAAGAAAVYLYKFHGSLFGWQPHPVQSSSKINYQKPTAEQQKAGSQTKQQSLSDKSTSTSGSDQPPAPIPQSNGTSTVQLTITAANETAPNLQVRAQIATVTNVGTCTLTLTKTGATTVTQTAQVQPFASISTCMGFSVPLSQLPAGQWNLAIHYAGGNLVGDASQTVTVH